MGLAAWEKPSDSPAWERDDRAWIPYVPELRAVRYGTNETQTITVDATTFTVTYRGDTIGPIPGNETVDEVYDWINAIPAVASGTVGTVNVTGTPGNYKLDWITGAFLGIDADVFEVTPTGGTATVEVTTPTDPVPSTDGSHIAEGFYRSDGRRVEARGRFVTGLVPAPTVPSLLGITLPVTPAPYRAMIGTGIVAQRNWWTIVCQPMVRPNADQTMSPHFVCLLGGQARTSLPGGVGIPGVLAADDFSHSYALDPVDPPTHALDVTMGPVKTPHIADPWASYSFEWYVTYEPEE